MSSTHAVGSYPCKQKVSKPQVNVSHTGSSQPTNNVKSLETPTTSSAEEAEKRAKREYRMKQRLEKKKRKREKRLLALALEAEGGKAKSSVVDLKFAKHTIGNASSKEKERKQEKQISLSKNEANLSLKQPKIIDPMQSMKPISKKIKIPKPNKIVFPINEECTSLKLSPSGRHIVAAFTDGTVRIFDTTGRLWQPSSSRKSRGALNDPVKSEMKHLFDSDSEEEEVSQFRKDISPRSKQCMVESKSFQNFGAVACQIHARGVITSLLMDVDCCEEGRFAFGGVLRGSTELVAIDLSQIEAYHDNFYANGGKGQHPKRDVLDLIRVHRHSDAKLKGFGACVRVKSSKKLEYRLFTGKGIKNMHIWSFIPPQGKNTEPSWQCLYDTPTNGNTITYLKFRRDANGLLQGISKSDDQKLRIWDLSHEDSEDSNEMAPKAQSVIKQLAQKADKEKCNGRPKRPPYIDVRSTENTLGVCGSYVFSGGDSMYNKMGVMFLDVEDIQSQFNHTELALPTIGNDETMKGLTSNRRSGRSGRQQRGDLKSVVRVAGLQRDAHHVVLELSDQSLVHYCQKGNQSSLVPISVTTTQTDRKMCITRVKQSSNTVLSLCSYDANKNRGSIVMRFLSENLEGGSLGSSARAGFSESSRTRQNVRLPTNISSLSTKAKVVPDCSAKEPKDTITRAISPTPKPKLNTTPFRTPESKLAQGFKLIDNANKITSEPASSTPENRLKHAIPDSSDKKRKKARDKQVFDVGSEIEGISTLAAKVKQIPQITSQNNATKITSEPASSSTPENKSNHAVTSSSGKKRKQKRDKQVFDVGSEIECISTPAAKVKQIPQISSQKGTKSKAKETHVAMTSIRENLLVTPDQKKRTRPSPDMKPMNLLSKKQKSNASTIPSSSPGTFQKKAPFPTADANVPPTGAAVSPEQQKYTDSTKNAPHPESDSVNNISKYFYNKSKSNTNANGNMTNQPKDDTNTKVKNAKQPKNDTTNTKVKNAKQPKNDTTNTEVKNAKQPKNDTTKTKVKNAKQPKDNTGAKGNKTKKPNDTGARENKTKQPKDGTDSKRSKTKKPHFSSRKVTFINHASVTKEVARKHPNGSYKIRIASDASGVKKTLREADVLSALEELRKDASQGKQCVGSDVLAVPPDHSLAALKARHELDEFLSNRQKRKRPKFACETNILSVSKRTALNIPARQQIQIGKQLDIEEAHCIARRQLAMQHRACHERFRNTVISSGERIMNIVTSEENVMAYSKNQLIEFTRNKIIESTIHHTNVLREMIERQRMEAESIMNTQALQIERKVPLLAVSFPFPEVFDQLENVTAKFLMD